MSKSLILKPRISEKAYGLSETRNTYVFEVPKSANKQTIKEAVEAQYEVSVETVNVTTIKGKVKRTYRRGGRSVKGVRNDIKKAYVLLKSGESLPIFAAENEQKEAEAKAAKSAKEKK